MYKKFGVLVLIFMFISCSAKAQMPSVSARAAVVIEASTGNIIYSRNHTQKLPMASTTKIMTAICTIENINTNFPVKVSDKAVGTEGSSIYLEKDEVITIKELLYGMMLNSGNDAAVALAIAVSGSVEDFCDLMNQTAKNIGAENTNFTNPSGLYEEDHYTTAYDLAIITAYALENPLFKEIVSTGEQKISNPKGGSRYLKNHNKLLWNYEGAIGVKTGYTKKCGRCLVSAAKRDGVTLVAVTLNAPDDWNDHRSMLDYGFSRVSVNTVFGEGDYATSTVVEGAPVPLCFAAKMEVSAVDIEDVSVEYSFEKNVSLPVFGGETLGMAKLVYNGKTVAVSELRSAKTIPVPLKKSFWKEFSEKIKLFIS